jgi:hypothetical protein
MRDGETFEENPDAPLYAAKISIQAAIVATLERDPQRPDDIGTLMLQVIFPPTDRGERIVTDKYPVPALPPDVLPRSPAAMEVVQSRARLFIEDIGDMLNAMLPALINNVTVLAISQAVANEPEKFFTSRVTFQLKIINALIRNIKHMLDLPDPSKPGPRRKTVAAGQLVGAMRKVARAGQPVTLENVAKQLEISVSTLERIIREQGVTFTAIKNGLISL